MACSSRLRFTLLWLMSRPLSWRPSAHASNRGGLSTSVSPSLSSSMGSGLYLIDSAWKILILLSGLPSSDWGSSLTWPFLPERSSEALEGLQLKPFALAERDRGSHSASLRCPYGLCGDDAPLILSWLWSSSPLLRSSSSSSSIRGSAVSSSHRGEPSDVTSDHPRESLDLAAVSWPSFTLATPLITFRFPSKTTRQHLLFSVSSSFFKARHIVTPSVTHRIRIECHW